MAVAGPLFLYRSILHRAIAASRPTEPSHWPAMLRPPNPRQCLSPPPIHLLAEQHRTRPIESALDIVSLLPEDRGRACVARWLSFPCSQGSAQSTLRYYHHLSCQWPSPFQHGGNRYCIFISV
ncbi:uncharacterized protein B0H18DRAFT_603679 [Fomitopsis serialis]|uniref:uncharacterized protein n=1 Tax=Fomitopsis serialis TaxID=139415 RepID=UPI0020084FDD|nr:uncharacterized protein B0H18DRAFT_603679 [Neoantrodia serialis]KAH9933869.1 hypothetical protein B0H18DRAFT_603679 [Neoantrodia serialis]